MEGVGGEGELWNLVLHAKYGGGGREGVVL